MEHNLIDKAELKRISEELQIPFSNLLAGYVIEELLYLIYDTGFGEYLWLKNDAFLGVGNYRGIQYFSLDFVYHTEEKVLRTEKLIPGQKMTEALAQEMISQIFVKEKNKKIRWKYKSVLKNDVLTVDVMAEFEEMKVPVAINFSLVEMQGIFPEKRELKLFVDPHTKINYKRYPTEKIIAEQIVYMVQFMELIPSMQPYDVVYQIIAKEPVDGRRIQETLAEICEKEEFICSEERIEMFAKYQNYSYMKKRWEKYAKHQKKEHKNTDLEIPEWQELIKILLNFMCPIWQSINKDEIFFGDWMPALGRYLD